MNIYYGIENIPADYVGACVTLGVFDGLHLAHRQIIQKVIELATEQNSRAMLITFEPHPRQILSQPSANHLPVLTTADEKIELLEKIGIEEVLFIKADRTFLNIEESVFVQEILVKKLKVRAVVVGYDYHFGRERRGNPQTLIAAGEKYGFKVVVIPPFAVNGVIVRSSLIRQILSDGKIHTVNQLLGWQYSFRGKVVRGTGRGHKLGFPTANLVINPPNKLIPGDGVYFVQACFLNLKYFGILNIGVRKTFNESKRVIELFIINFQGEELYNREIKVIFIERLRDELKFETSEALKKQMQADLEICLAKINKIENETEVCFK
ncbi:MAG TPA: bifunctional riboflavin kinase/FAD synthetase [Candidatus Marinimicrobia bacterium]|nr:bifunctional riboflavin kinase/FAD synthetase [Candidatus Neomarinimicrobiota bacterium]HRS51551.1 bifunctional riboflavin kinase/FAD synthetase [Candidatus Neomarinimicrobiota bacterium]HRU92929.1 bifunctional riboflavin kinase/FAD synthetase [Candidatus Neomarinimicrobiota bacterium]